MGNSIKLNKPQKGQKTDAFSSIVLLYKPKTLFIYQIHECQDKNPTGKILRKNQGDRWQARWFSVPIDTARNSEPRVNLDPWL